MTTMTTTDEGLNIFPAAIANKCTVDSEGCWVHSKGTTAQTRHPKGSKQLLGKYVWKLSHDEELEPQPEDGDFSVRPLESCDPRCVNPEHLERIAVSERIHRARAKEDTRNSEYLGVAYHAQSGTWQARLYLHGGCYSGGYHATEKDAAERFDQMAAAMVPDRPTNHSMGLLDTVPEPRAWEPHKAPESPHRGVLLIEDKWIARSTIDGKQYHLGTFTDEDDAAKAVNKFTVEHGLDRPLNVV